MLVFPFILTMIGLTVSTPHEIDPTNYQDDIGSLKYAVKFLAVQIEKWNHLFLTSLEPRIASSASNLASIETKINNLQERAHIWDTFQLHVVAWNDQLASIDRKIDIVSSAQDKLLNLHMKLNSITAIDYKLDDILKKMEKFHTILTKLNKADDDFNHNILVGEFTSRGILSTVSMVERKLDKLLSINQTNIASNIDNGKIVRCNSSRIMEDLMKDMASKIDIIFDRIIGKDIEGSASEEIIDLGW